MTKNIDFRQGTSDKNTFEIEWRKDELRFEAIIKRLWEVLDQLGFLKEDSISLSTLRKLENQEVVSDEEFLQFSIIIKQLEWTPVMAEYGESAKSLLWFLSEKAVINNTKSKVHNSVSWVGATLRPTGGY